LPENNLNEDLNNMNKGDKSDNVIEKAIKLRSLLRIIFLLILLVGIILAFSLGWYFSLRKGE